MKRFRAKLDNADGSVVYEARVQELPTVTVDAEGIETVTEHPVETVTRLTVAPNGAKTVAQVEPADNEDVAEWAARVVNEMALADGYDGEITPPAPEPEPEVIE